MSEPLTLAAAPAPKIGFVSLGCPKALTDSELILTQLSAEGYATSKRFEGAGRPRQASLDGAEQCLRIGGDGSLQNGTRRADLDHA
jgi:hypothetical protein